MRRCHCGKFIQSGHGYKKSKKYCSYQCYKNKPPLVLKIEEEFQESIESIIQDLEQSSMSQIIKSYTLGINRGTYTRWVNKYGRT